MTSFFVFILSPIMPPSPSLCNCSTILLFPAWSSEALTAVAMSQLSGEMSGVEQVANACTSACGSNGCAVSGIWFVEKGGHLQDWAVRVRKEQYSTQSDERTRRLLPEDQTKQCHYQHEPNWVDV